MAQGCRQSARSEPVLGAETCEAQPLWNGYSAAPENDCASRHFGSCQIACRAVLAIFLCFSFAALARGEDESTAKKRKPAKLEISGYGFPGNRLLKRTLTTLLFEKKRPDIFDAAFIEDAALILMSQLNRDGFLQPALAAELTLEDGQGVTFLWDEAIEAPLPTSLRARRVHFKILEGVRYHYEKLVFSGLNTVSEKKARAFFIETGGVLPLARYRIYTPERLRRGLDSLVETLNRNGYAKATATAEEIARDDKKGEVVITVHVNEGPRHFARSVAEEIYFGTNTNPTEVRKTYPGKPYSRIFMQDYAQMLRTNFYVRGFPDTTVDMRVAQEQEQSSKGVVQVDLAAKIQTGRRVRVGDVLFLGNQRTKRPVLDRRVPIESGDLLDRVKAEHGRLRLSRLGVFESVELAYEPIDDYTRNISYRLREGKRVDLNLLAGWGSYEMLRGGFELEQFNVFGRAHHSRLRAIQSFRSSSGNYTYTMPELLGEDWDVFFRGFGLRREEVTFTRVEYGGGAGVQRNFRKIASSVALRYDYQVLSATEADVDFEEQGVQSPGVGAVSLDFRHDRRNNPLYPERGYKIFSNFELASELLGGEVNYQRFELAASYHWPLGASRRMHFGLSHGFIASVGSPADDLPFTRRFFPGGENSIRGYQEGEASPRDEDDDEIGAETYLLGMVEFEQALTPQWSVVIFSDNLGVSRDLKDYPGREALFSVGGGLRWRTIIGPVRLEYGHNLNPRDGDPSGTLHFSFGFPF
jgi:outer membrane protein assembly complex protein YaeT